MLTLTITPDILLRDISPLIYGSNGERAGFLTNRPRGITLARFGGNRTSAYNYTNDASNSGTDETGTGKNQNDSYLAGGVAERMRVAAQAGASTMLVTVPMLGYVAADTGPKGDVELSGSDYLTKRFVPSAVRTAGAPAGAVAQEGFVRQAVALARQYGLTVHFALDNEPDLWPETHPRLHPALTTYGELIARTLAYASMIKDVAPEALVYGPVSYGWYGWERLGHGSDEAPDAQGRSFLDVFVSALAAEEKRQGRRLVDIIDLHWYPEWHDAAWNKPSGNVTTPEMVAARVQAPRELWDPTFTQGAVNWIEASQTNGPIKLIPRIKARLPAGVQLALTEYCYGGGGHISGALAQVEALGAFGREGLFAATLWEMQDSPYSNAAFSLFRNYDGQGATFGDKAIAATSSDPVAASVFAARGPAGVTAVVTNKTSGWLDTSLPAPGVAYQLTDTGPTVRAVSSPAGSMLRLPPMSATLFVVGAAPAPAPAAWVEVSVAGAPFVPLSGGGLPPIVDGTSLMFRAQVPGGVATAPPVVMKLPAAPPPPPPPPPPAWAPAFVVRPNSGEWWLEVEVEGATGVLYSVNGGVFAPLSLGWGHVWVSPPVPMFHIPTGATVVFKATRADGVTAERTLKWGTKP